MSLRSYYQYCVVPGCENNSKRTPTKLFIPVPRDPEFRKLWLDLSRRDWTQFSANTTMYFCEDHFDLPNDMENYIKFTVLGSVKKIRMRKGCLPSRFDCQPDRIPSPDECSNDDTKRKKNEIIEEMLYEDDSKRIGMSKASCTKIQNTDSLQDDEKHQKSTKVQDKAVQVQMYNKYRSKGSQIMPKLLSKATSPVKSFPQNVSVSTCTDIPSTSGNTHSYWTFDLKDQQTSESEVSLLTPSVKLNSSSSAQSLQDKLASDNSLNEEFLKVESDLFKEESLQHTLKKIERNPRYYIGVPKSCYFLVNIIAKQHSIPEEHILLCLKKLRLNTTFSELGDEFGISLNYASKIFLKKVPIIAKALQQFIKLDDYTDKARKLNLPISFRHRYFNVSCIIDCLEIEIQKPTKALNQALTWSEYKKGNTIKYLISCTPDGLINYISPGYGGRISDVLLVENCKFLDSLRPGSFLLADRGFKHIEQLMSQKGLKLLRPPSVPSGTKLSKQEKKKTKQIASIRIHIERVIRRLREFSMFKLHSVINTNLLRIVDEAVTICCALINLQDGIIK